MPPSRGKEKRISTSIVEDSPPAAAAAPAPAYKVASREITAVEHPMVIKNLDNGIKTFGRNQPFARILDSIDPEECVPLYLRYNDPMCNPILSHNTPTNNLLLKITVPKRTGRKRKRGSQDPYTDDNSTEVSIAEDVRTLRDRPSTLLSTSEMDLPAQLMRKMKDNQDNYQVEAVGNIRQTHRFRGLADFHHSTSHTEFMPKFQETVLTGDIEKMREFKFNLSRGWKPNEELLPPPSMTGHTLPFNWGWHQNPNIVEDRHAATGERILVNRSKPTKVSLKYLSHDVESIPNGPSAEVPDDPPLRQLVASLKEALEVRPVWTRRSLINHVSDSPVLYLVRVALQYVSYQFKGGPFRDAIIKFGVDPRTDKKYRQYQTFFFKLYEEEEKVANMPWREVRTSFNISKRSGKPAHGQTHIFNGKSLTLDGKVWQVCDITDPLLAKLIREAPYPDQFDSYCDGYFCNGTVAKIKAIMKVKLVAIRAQREVRDEDFREALQVPDHIPGKQSRLIQVPVPDMRLTQEELDAMRQRGQISTVQSNGIRKRDLNIKARSERIRPRVAVQGRAPRRPPGSKRVDAVTVAPKRKSKAYRPAPGSGSEMADASDPTGVIDPNLAENGESSGLQLPATVVKRDMDETINFGKGNDEDDIGGDQSDDELTDGEDDLGSEVEDGGEDYDSEASDLVDFVQYYPPES